MKRALSDRIVVAVVAVGLLATVGASVMIYRAQEADATRWLSERAELIARATEESLESAFSDLRATAAFLAASPVTQEEFGKFVDALELDPAMIGIGYVAVVEPSELDAFLEEIRQDIPTAELQSWDGAGGIGPDDEPRPIYYPVRYVHGGPFLDFVVAETPIDRFEDMLGFDLATEPLWLPFFERALALETPSLSDLVELGGLFEQHTFNVMHPIYENGELVGVLIASGLEGVMTADLGVAITSGVTWQADNAPPAIESQQWPVWQRQLDVPGSTWTLTVQPTDEERKALTGNGHWTALAVGLILTAAVAAGVRQSRLRRQERDTVAQLSKLAEDKDRFLATVSHELRTPLTVVIGLAAELATSDEFDTAERRELLEMIEEHGQEASAIVEDLLVAARSDIDKIAIRPEQLDPLHAINLAVAASPFDEVPVVGECPAIVADPARLQQILRNLLSNADRYGGPEVEIRVECNGEGAAITVADSGDPIATSKAQAIFDPYVSAHEGNAHNGSIGLGLFISRKLARLMDGDLTYRHDGRHVLFELTLPRAPARKPAPA